ncbi:MAG: 50S ribosomal protein L13 [Candidatus Nanohaloarchaea archaeon]
MAEVVDGDGRVLGRLASHVAERLKDGEEIKIVNSEKSVVTGDKEEVFEKYRERRDKGSVESGPDFPEAPDRIVKRTVRGMLPDNHDGREAFKRLKTYRGNPEGLETVETGVKTVEDLERRNAVTVEEISENI